MTYHTCSKTIFFENNFIFEITMVSLFILKKLFQSSLCNLCMLKLASLIVNFSNFYIKPPNISFRISRKIDGSQSLTPHFRKQLVDSHSLIPHFRNFSSTHFNVAFFSFAIFSPLKVIKILKKSLHFGNERDISKLSKKY